MEGLLDPAILEPNVRDSNDLPLRLKGCSCEVPRTNGMFAMTSFPTCLRVDRGGPQSGIRESHSERGIALRTKRQQG